MTLYRMADSNKEMLVIAMALGISEADFQKILSVDSAGFFVFSYYFFKKRTTLVCHFFHFASLPFYLE